MDTETDIEGGYHWQLMRRAIARLDAGRDLSLEEIAAEMGLSPAHFHRVFSRWAGTSPKRFQQYLALGHAKRLLDERSTTLETAGALGLSGTGRLHDLFVTWEAMSPGDYARRGRGLTIRWATGESPFGPFVALATERGLAGLAFTAEIGAKAAFDDLAGRWPEATFVQDRDALAQHLEAISSERGRANLHLVGGPFQIKVWEALLRIPAGRVATYAEIARAIGHPGAYRAVGTAVGRNPIGRLIPCHRALRASGGLGGYHWGLPVKRALLADETARAVATDA